MGDVFRPAGITYLRIPAPDPACAADFYEAVFGWRMRRDPHRASFEDGTGDVIGHLSPDEEVAGAAGIRPYVYVDDLDSALERVVASGGTVVEPSYAEGDLRVATFHDPAGNVVGVWQRTAAS